MEKKITNREAVAILKLARKVFDKDDLPMRDELLASLDRSIESLISIEKLNIEYDVYHFEDEYWRGVKHALDFFETDNVET